MNLGKKVPSLRGISSQHWPIAPVLIGLLAILSPELNLNAGQGVEHIIQMVNLQYGKIKSIQGIINRKIRNGQNTQRVTGRFLIKKPDRSYVEFADPHQIVCSNDSLCWVENVVENVVHKFPIAKMNEFEREILGVRGLIELNLFDQLKDGFDFYLSDTLDGDLVIAARPKAPGKFLSKILVKVDPRRWIILAYEIFDLKGKMVSQTKYLDYKLYADSLLFPMKVSIKSAEGTNLLEETDEFSQLRLNSTIPDSNFDFIPPKNAKIVTPKG